MDPDLEDSLFVIAKTIYVKSYSYEPDANAMENTLIEIIALSYAMIKLLQGNS